MRYRFMSRLSLKFQSTLPYGSDDAFVGPLRSFSTFQSTLPYGSDRNEALDRFLRRYFNPRSLTGATMPSQSISADNVISIHAPLRERLSARSILILSLSFQSTLPYGSDRNNILRLFVHYFNPRSLTGATFNAHCKTY